MKRKRVELLSPAGSYESLQAAICAGADAVYFGVEQLNMRTRSSHSFTIPDIQRIGAICREAVVKCYITLNTVMYDHDMQLLKAILREVKECHVDAVIASDMAVINYCRQMSIPLHISTQANISNVEAVQAYSGFADVMVLARELTLNQIGKITREVKRKKIMGPSGDLVRIEIFIHGALCMAISGKCYLSLHTQNASANRGACVQNCRRPYRVIDAELGEELLINNQYIMSPKDLCTIDLLDQVMSSGADVLKIEGRSKGADYVQVVTQCYREAIDAIYNNSYTPDKIAVWKQELAKVYNRGFWEGYYLGRKFGEWTSHPGSAASERKIYAGKGTNYYPRIGIGEFLIEAGSIKAGDTLMTTGKHFGVLKEKLERLCVNGKECKEAVKGDRVTFPVPAKLSPGDRLYKIVTEDA